jgi:hypothetical protein
MELQARSRSDGAAGQPCGTWSSRPRRTAVLLPQFCLHEDDLHGTDVTVDGPESVLAVPRVPAQIGLALEGRTGTRLAALLGIAVQRSTLQGPIATG